MHLFRSVFVFGFAALAYVAMEAPQASAFILPMTRYMLDAIPDGEAPEGDVTTGADGGAPASAADNVVNTDVPVAVDTPVIVAADDQEQSEDTPVVSSEAAVPPSVDSAEPTNISAATSAASDPESPVSTEIAAAPSSASPVIPSASVSDNILAQANAAHHVLALGGPSVLVGAILATILSVV